MARRYVRDNRGRFATTGATARGGRLRTASGNKRKAQTMKAASGEPKRGTIKRSTIKARRTEKPTAARSGRRRTENKLPGVAPRSGRRSTKPLRTRKPASNIRPLSPGQKLRLKGGAKGLLKKARQQADDLKKSLRKSDESRLNKALKKPSVTDKRSRDYLGKLTKEGKRQDPTTGGKKTTAKTSKRQAAKSKPASQPKVTRLGGRIDPARQADRASTAKVNKALSAEKAARAAAFSSKEAFSSPKRQELNRKLNEATQNTAAEIQTRRNVRASFPVMRKTPTIKASRPSGTIKAPTSTKAQRNRASQNLARSLDSRGRAVGKKDRRTKKAAERAAQFYDNPLKALKSVKNKGTGFKLPRSMRRKRK